MVIDYNMLEQPEILPGVDWALGEKRGPWVRFWDLFWLRRTWYSGQCAPRVHPVPPRVNCRKERGNLRSS